MKDPNSIPRRVPLIASPPKSSRLTKCPRYAKLDVAGQMADSYQSALTKNRPYPWASKFDISLARNRKRTSWQ